MVLAEMQMPASPATLFQRSSVHARMTDDETLTISVKIPYPINGFRWTQLFKGPLDDPQLPGLLTELEGLCAAVRERIPEHDEPEEPDRWYEGVYRR